MYYVLLQTGPHECNTYVRGPFDSIREAEDHAAKATDVYETILITKLVSNYR